MTLVYMLNTYDEYGPEEIMATLDAAKLEPHIRTAWTATSDKAEPYKSNEIAHKQKWIDDAIIKLRKLLETGKPDSYNLHDGWGGLQLHIIELQ